MFLLDQTGPTNSVCKTVCINMGTIHLLQICVDLLEILSKQYETFLYNKQVQLTHFDRKDFSKLCDENKPFCPTKF